MTGDQPPKQSRRPSRRLILIGAAIFLAILGGLWAVKPNTSNSNESKMHPVVRKDIAEVLQLSGKIVPERTMVVTAQESGRLVSLAVKEGAKVEAGQLLFTMRLEAEGQTALMQRRSEVKALELEVASATRQFNDKSLVRELIGTAQVAKEENDLQKLKLDLAAARERLQVVESNLGLTGHESGKTTAQSRHNNQGLVYVTAPTQGIVTLIDKRPGDFLLGGVGASSSDSGGANERMVMVVADMSTLQVRTRVLEADLRHIGQDLPVKVRLDAYPDISYKGKVEHIGGQGRTEAKAGYTYFDVYVTIDQQDGRLLPEMNATVDLMLSQKEKALTLPVTAVLILPNKALVRVKDAGDSRGFRYLAVAIGAVTANDVEIVSGLKEGDQVMEIDFSSPQIFDATETPQPTITTAVRK